jgi:uncharacterized membrane protein
MENVEKLLTNWQLHPVVDHFSIALLVVAVLIDVVALIFSQRISLRHTALTLMIIGAIAAAASYGTGDIEGDRVWDLVSAGKAHDVLKLHAQLGYYLMIAFAVLALWRILIEAVGFMQSTRQVYLALAVVAVGVLLYQGSLGGELVYTFGVGTGQMAAGAVRALASPKPAQSEAATAPTAIPTVYIPTAAATPAPEASAAPTAEPTSAPAGEGGASKSAAPSPEAEPSAKPSV